MAAYALAAIGADEVTCSCGITFGVPKTWLDDRRNDKRDFHCQNGHSLSFRESEIDRLKKQLEQKELLLVRERKATAFAQQQRDRVERQKTALKGQVTKIKNRVSNGVCPCCKRHFTNLERHMGTKHPDFKEQDIG